VSDGVLRLDHWQLVTDRAYRRDVRVRIIEGARRALEEAKPPDRDATIVHLPGHQCCEREPWPVTYEKLLQELRADGVPAQAARPLTGHEGRFEIRQGRGPVYGPNIVQLPERN
jgi:hypothetical protein